MFYKKPIGGLATLLVGLTVAVSACGGDDGGSSSGGGASLGDGKKVTFIIPSLQNDYYLAQQRGAKATQKRYPNADVSIVTGTGDGSGADLIAKVEDALTKQADVIAINTSNPDPLRAVLAKAANQGSKVVLFDTPIPALKEQTAWIGADNYRSGQLAGRWMKDNVPSGDVGILHCLPGIKISDDRVKGFRDAIADTKLKVVSVLDAKCDRAKGRSTMEDMISAHPDLAGVYSISDTQTLGAVGALPKGKKPTVVSIDAQDEAVKNISAGKGIAASVRQNPQGMGATALKVALEVADGKTVPKETKIPQLVVDKANAAKYGG